MENFEKRYCQDMEKHEVLSESKVEELKEYNIVKKHEYCRRGFGSMTAALYKNNENQWDYIEVIYPYDGEYQRGCQALDKKDADKLIGMNIKDIKKAEWVRVLRGKWHEAKISPDGEILSLIC